MNRDPLPRERFAPPSYRISLLRTSGLVRLESDGLAHRLIVVCAPAGYGKTVTLTQWRTTVRASGARTAWLAIGRDPIDSAQLLTCLAASLIEAGVDLGRIEQLIEHWFTDTPIRSAVASLISELRKADSPVLVVVDDVHHLSRETIEQVLGPLLDAGLPRLHVALAGRTRPALALADLRARGELLELTIDSMRFTSREVEALVPDVPRAQREVLEARTQGWPVALQLARLWLAANPARLGLIAGFSGHTTEVAEFLTEQVLGDLPDRVRATLEITAPLDALCAGVVEAVTGSPNAWSEVSLLPTLAHLVVRVDDTHDSYRLHPLLADYLRDRLRRNDPEGERGCHAKASAWYEAQGLRLEAVRHAAAAGDVARAAALIERTGGWELVLFGGTGLMVALVREIPEHRLPDFPRVEIYRAFLDAKGGHVLEARKRFDEARASVSRDGVAPSVATPAGRDLHIVGHLLARYEDRVVEAGALESIYREVETLASDDAFGRATLLNTACLLGLALGDMRAAHEACSRAVREMRGLGSVLGLNYCSLHLGLASLHLGHRREAEAIFREALDLAEENFGADSGLRAVADIHLAIALVGRGDIAGATRLIHRSLDHIEQFDGWLDIYAEGYAAAISAAISAGANQGAEGLVERAAMTAARRRLNRLQTLAEVFHVRLLIRAGRLRDAERSEVLRKSAWASRPFHWREQHAIGVARAELELAQGNGGGAGEVVTALITNAATLHRARDLLEAEFLSNIAAHLRGARDEAAAGLMGLLGRALPEDDSEFLVQPGLIAVPLLQYARQWARDRGGSALARHAIGEALRRLTHADTLPEGGGPAHLSERELEVLLELAQGSPNKVIARALQMTENTVKFHLKNIFHKLDVRHRAQAIRAARDRGLIH